MEHASGECFKDGGALAEVMSLYESTSEDNLVDHPYRAKQSSKVTVQGNHRLTIEVLCLLVFLLHGTNYMECLASLRPFSDLVLSDILSTLSSSG